MYVIYREKAVNTQRGTAFVSPPSTKGGHGVIDGWIWAEVTAFDPDPAFWMKQLTSDEFIGLGYYYRGDETLSPTELSKKQLGKAVLASVKLNKAQEEALDTIDRVAGRVRLKYVTSVPGQSETYMMKAQEAERYFDLGCPPNRLNEFPFIATEALINNITGLQACNQILAVRNAWKVLGARIEHVRLSGKNLVRQATEVSDVQSIMNQTTTHLLSL